MPNNTEYRIENSVLVVDRNGSTVELTESRMVVTRFHVTRINDSEGILLGVSIEIEFASNDITSLTRLIESTYVL